MKNNLVDLQNYLFTMIKTLNNKELKGEDLKGEISRAIAITEIAKVAITNGALMVKAADTLYGLPVSDDLPLIPKSPVDNPTFFKNDRKALIKNPMRRS